MDGLSKNSMRGRKRRGGTYLTKAARKQRDRLIAAVVEQSEGMEWIDAKVWLKIHVYRPDFRADPINVLEAIADAVKVAINVDDDWFAVAELDWSMDKENPRIEIEVWQTADEPQKACGRCGRILPQSEFWKGQGRCKVCHKEAVNASKQKEKQN